MNSVFVLTKYYMLLSGTATTQYMDSCRPWRQDREQPVLAERSAQLNEKIFRK